MSAPASMKIDIPGVDFAQMAREAIAARLTEALVGSEDVVKKIVASAFEHKVNDRGQVSNYSYENKIAYVEWVAQDLVRSATLDVLKTKVEQLRPAIEKAVEAELKRSTKAAAKVLTEHFIASAKNGYGFQASVTFSAVDRR